MARRNPIVVWKLSGNLSKEEAERRVEKAFDILFDAVERRREKARKAN